MESWYIGFELIPVDSLEALVVEICYRDCYDEDRLFCDRHAQHLDEIF